MAVRALADMLPGGLFALSQSDCNSSCGISAESAESARARLVAAGKGVAGAAALPFTGSRMQLPFTLSPSSHCHDRSRSLSVDGLVVGVLGMTVMAATSIEHVVVRSGRSSSGSSSGSSSATGRQSGGVTGRS